MIARRSFRPRPRALAGALVVGAAVAALSGCSLIGNLAGGGGDDVFSIEVGDCLNDAELSGEITSVPVVPCSEPHDSEAFYSHILDASERPSDENLFAEADEVCQAEFEAFVGLPYIDSILAVTYYYPTESSWANGDREVLCLVYDPEGQVTGSLEAAAR